MKIRNKITAQQYNSVDEVKVKSKFNELEKLQEEGSNVLQYFLSNLAILDKVIRWVVVAVQNKSKL